MCTFDDTRNHVGHYVTLGQKDTREVAHGGLFLKRVSIHADDHMDFMQSAKVLTASEGREAANYLDALRRAG